MFLAQYNASQGYLSQEYQAQLQAQVGEYVNTLMGDPVWTSFHIFPLTPLSTLFLPLAAEFPLCRLCLTKN